MLESPATAVEGEVQMYEIQALTEDKKVMQTDNVLAKSVQEAVEIAMLEGLLMGAPALRIGPLNEDWRLLLRIKKFSN